MKKLFILLFILLLMAGGGWFVLTTFVIDAENLSEQLSATLEEATGRQVQVSQTAEVTVYPLPEVTFNGLTISNMEGASSPDFISSSKVTMKLSFADLLAGSAVPSEIIMDGASIHLEVLPGGQKNWKFKGKSAEFQRYFVNTPVKFNKAVLHYVNAATGSRTQVEGINGVLRYEEQGKIVSFTGDVQLHGHDSQVVARMSSVDMTSTNAPDVPFQLALKHMGATITAQGKLSGANKDPEFIGQIKMEAPNLWSVIGMYTGDQPKTMVESAPDTGFSAEGNMRLSSRHMIMEAMKISAKGSSIPGLEGILEAEYGFGKLPLLQIKSDFEMVDLDYLTDSYRKWYVPEPVKESTPPKPEEISTEIQAKNDQAFSQLLEHLSGGVEVSIASLIYNGRALSDLQFSALLTPGKMIVQQSRANMPGETVMSLVGEAQNRKEGLTFDGKFAIQGKEMDQFFTLFASKGAQIPPLELGQFVMRTNMSISPTQFRFSEFQGMIGDTRMAGSVILRRGDRLALESYLRIADINLDTLGKAAQYLLPEDEGIKPDSSGDGGEELFDVQYVNTRFNWLNAVGIDINSDFYLQDFVLLDRKGEAAKFNLKVGVGEITIDQLQARYNGAAMTGKYGIRSQIGSNPLIVADGAMSELDMVDIFPDLARSRNDKEWLDYIDKQMELLPLQTYRADAKLRVSKLIIRNYTFEDVDAEMRLDNSTLDIEKLNFRMWDGAANARLRIQAGTIPSMSSSFRIQNANLLHLSEATSLLKHAAGRTALTGRLATSGVSLLSWYNNMQGEIRVQGQDISVQGFGIANLARAVPVARTVNDVERAAKMATHGGVTRMSTIDGIINVAQGKAGIPQMRFTSAEATGSVEGSVDLVKEDLDLKMNFYLLNTVTPGETPPMLTLNLTGDIDNVQKELETRELKNYVAQSAAQRALGKTQ